MKNQDQIEKFEQALDKFKFAQPVSIDLQKQILKSKPRVFQRILKSLGKYTLITGIVVGLYFALKKFGATALVSKMIITATVASSVTVGTYYTVRIIQQSLKPKIIGISISKKELLFKKKGQVLDFTISGIVDKNNKTTISNKAVIAISPKGIAKVEKLKNDIVFIKLLKEKSGKINITYKKISKFIEIVFLDKEQSKIVNFLTVTALTSSTIKAGIIATYKNYLQNVISQYVTNKKFNFEGSIEKVNNEYLITLKLIQKDTHKLTDMKIVRVKNKSAINGQIRSMSMVFYNKYMR